MPRRIVTLHLWEIAVAFVAVTAAFVFAVVIATQASNKAAVASREANHTALQAQKIAVDLKRTADATRALRRRQLEIVQEIADTSCRARHVIVFGQIAAYEQAITLVRQFLKGPGGQLPGVRDTQLKNIRVIQRLLVRLRAADCLSVPSILHPKKK